MSSTGPTHPFTTKEALIIPGRTLLRLLLLLPLFICSRLLLYPFNTHYFPESEAARLLSIVWHGLPFDISALLMSNSLFLLLVFFPVDIQRYKPVRILTDLSFLLPNIAGLGLNIIDAGYFSYSLRRTSTDLFQMLWSDSSIFHLLFSYSIDFWPLALIFLTSTSLVLVIWHCVGLPHKSQIRRISLRFVLFLTIGGLSVTGVRGGMQIRPLWIISAGYHADARFTQLITNTPFIIFKSLHKPRLKPRPFACSQTYDPEFQGRLRDEPAEKLNIIVLILESFSAEHIGFLNPGHTSITPFLDSIAAEGTSFMAISNSSRSIEAMPSILCSLPPLMDLDFIQSVYSGNRINSLASLLKTEGYQSAFFHGGSNGSMSLDAFTGLAGFDKYFGRDEYGNDAHYDGKWGIFDEEFLSFACSRVSAMAEPFACGIFTLSSHHPYILPEKHEHRFNHIESHIQRSIAYTDYSLRRFFEQAARSDWYNNTLFVITADHASTQKDEKYRSVLMRRAIPLVFFRPGIKGKGRCSELVQQTDILPTVLDSIAPQLSYVGFGQDLFATGIKPFSVSYANGIYMLHRQNRVIQADQESLLNAYSMKDSTLQSISTSDTGAVNQFEFLKAFVNEYNTRMVENRLTVPSIPPNKNNR